MGFDESIFHKKADDRHLAMLTQHSRVNGGDAEPMPHGVYFGHRLRHRIQIMVQSGIMNSTRQTYRVLDAMPWPGAHPGKSRFKKFWFPL